MLVFILFTFIYTHLLFLVNIKSLNLEKKMWISQQHLRKWKMLVVRLHKFLVLYRWNSPALTSVFEDNTGLAVLRCISECLHSSTTNIGAELQKYTHAKLSNYVAAPITSCEVERSFNKLKNLFRSNRSRLEFHNLRMHMFIHCNKE